MFRRPVSFLSHSLVDGNVHWEEEEVITHCVKKCCEGLLKKLAGML